MHILHSQCKEIERRGALFKGKGYIEKSVYEGYNQLQSVYGAPIVPVVKKDSTLRMCNNYRQFKDGSPLNDIVLIV